MMKYVLGWKEVDADADADDYWPSAPAQDEDDDLFSTPTKKSAPAAKLVWVWEGGD